MCFADSSVSVELEEGNVVMEEYECLECNSSFKGIGKRVRCPSCDSVKVKKV